MQKISPFLWFDTQAEEAVDFYLTVFPDARKGRVTRYNEAFSRTHRQGDDGKL